MHNTTSLLLSLAVKKNYTVSIYTDKKTAISSDELDKIKYKFSDVDLHNFGTLKIIIDKTDIHNYEIIRNYETTIVTPKTIKEYYKDIDRIMGVDQDDIDAVILIDYTLIYQVALEFTSILGETEISDAVYKIAISAVTKPNSDYSLIDINDYNFSNIPHFIKPDFLLNLGYELYFKDKNYIKYRSNKDAKYHIAKGLDCKLGIGRRFYTFQCNNGYISCGVRCDGDSRTIFDGVIKTEQDLLNLVRLID